MDSKKEAAKRVGRAEMILAKVDEDIQKAQASISSIGTGLNQEYAKLTNLRKDLQQIVLSLQRNRHSGKCDLDETMIAILEKRKIRA
jgi:hypothetical protein